MKDWKEGVEHGISEAMNAKDKWEAFILKIDEARAIIEDVPTIAALEAVEVKVKGYIETLKQEIKDRL